MENFYNKEKKKITGLTLAIILFVRVVLNYFFNW